MLSIFKNELQGILRNFSTSDKVLNFLFLLGIVYFLSTLVMFSIKLNIIFNTIFPHQNYNELVFEGYFYFILFDFMLKFFLQSSKGIAIKYYLVLPIKKQTLISYIIIKDLFSLLNFYTIPLLLSVGTNYIFPQNSYQITILWIFMSLFLCLINTQLVAILKRNITKNLAFTIFILSFLGLIIFLDRYNLLSISKISFLCLQFLISNGLIMLFPIIIFITLWIKNRIYIAKNLYTNENQSKINMFFDINLFKDKGLITSLITNEINLIIRNKRPKQFFIANFIFTVMYAIIGFEQKSILTEYFFSILIMGFPIIGYLQLSFGWQSRYFDGILTKSTQIKDILKAKVIFFDIYCILISVLLLPLTFTKPHLLLIIVAALSFNIGIYSYLLVWFTSYNTKPIDLGKSTFMNYQGINATQFLGMIPVLFIPFIEFRLLSLITESNNLIFSMIILLNLSFLLVHRYLIKFIYIAFLHNKHEITEGFKRV